MKKWLRLFAVVSLLEFPKPLQRNREKIMSSNQRKSDAKLATLEKSLVKAVAGEVVAYLH